MVTVLLTCITCSPGYQTYMKYQLTVSLVVAYTFHDVLTCRKRNYRVRSSKDWNMVPELIKVALTLDQFKKSILNHLIENGDFWVP